MAGNRWLVLVSMTGSLSMIMLDQTVVSVALPAMAADLSLSADERAVGRSTRTCWPWRRWWRWADGWGIASVG